MLLMPLWVKIPLIGIAVMVGAFLLLVGVFVFGIQHYDYNTGEKKK